MPKISVTVFTSYVIASGSPKQTVVENEKKKGDYDPQTDFWRLLRQAIRDMHRDGRSIAALTSLQRTITHPAKVSAYPVAISGYKKWLGRKQPLWFDPPRHVSSYGGLDVVINPELGLEWNVGGVPTRHIIKAYFKQAKPAKKMMDIVLTLMRDAFPTVSTGAELGVLDVQRGRLYTASSVRGNLMPLVQAEAASFATLWSLLP